MNTLINNKTIGIIGYGAFGKFLHEVFNKYFPEVSVRISSRSNDVDNKTFFSLDDTCNVDYLIPCVPIATFSETIDKIVDKVDDNTIIIDICTVKSYPREVLIDKNIKFMCTHPMFGPNSYKKIGEKLDGLRIVLCDHNLGNSEYEFIKETLSNLKLKIIEISSDKHDKILADTLFLTHFTSQILRGMKSHRTEIDTVSYGFLMDALDSVKDDRQLFYDVYKYNPHCKTTIEEFKKSMEEITRGLSS